MVKAQHLKNAIYNTDGFRNFAQPNTSVQQSAVSKLIRKLQKSSKPKPKPVNQKL